MLLDSFIEGVFLSGFFTGSSEPWVLHGGFRTESATVRLHCVSSAPPVCPCGVNVKVHADGEETFTYCLNDSLYNLVRIV